MRQPWPEQIRSRTGHLLKVRVVARRNRRRPAKCTLAEFTNGFGKCALLEVKLQPSTTCPLEIQPEFARRHPVIDLISVRVHSNEQEALVAEVMLWNLWAGKLKDPQRVRGGRLNMAGPMPHLPRGWPRNLKKPAKEENDEQGASSTS